MSKKPNYIRIGSRLTDVYNSVRAAKANGGRINGLLTGFRALDEMLDGLRPSTLTVLAARPKQGKTAFAVSVMRKIALDGHCVYFASLEMPTDEIAKRLVAIEANVTYEALSRGRYHDNEEQAIRDGFSRVSRLPLLIDDSRQTVAGLYEQSSYAVQKQGAKLVVVDYLQYITPAEGGSRYEAVTAISMALAEMRKALGVPILALAQLSRKTAERATEMDFAKFNPAASRPKDSDLRESGQIEQDADSLVFINRPEVYLEDLKPMDVYKEADWRACMSKYVGKAELIVHFNRNGGRGIITCSFNGKMMLFSELSDIYPAM